MSRLSPGRGNGRGNGSSVAAGAGFAAAKGAGLIGLAVIIGIVLLNVVDDGSKGSANNAKPSATTTSVSETTRATTSTTVDKVPAKTPAELSVLVLNGGAPQGTAKNMADDLKVKGYTNSLPPSDWSGHQQTGNVVMCKSGLDQEAAALATAVGEGTPVQPFANPAPPGSGNADCVVVVGKAG
jgi:hypothetical protein